MDRKEKLLGAVRSVKFNSIPCEWPRIGHGGDWQFLGNNNHGNKDIMVLLRCAFVWYGGYWRGDKGLHGDL